MFSKCSKKAITFQLIDGAIDRCIFRQAESRHITGAGYKIWLMIDNLAVHNNSEPIEITN